MSDSETYVTPKVAQPYWAKHAYEVLVETAGRYNAVITYSELAEEVQRRSALHTRSAMRNWIGGLLADLVKVNHLRGEPPLTSLVVHKQDGQVGDGYDEVCASMARHRSTTSSSGKPTRPPRASSATGAGEPTSLLMRSRP
ncbi:hypothetical protein [Terrabacter sp. BE26]|uniref:hypothetical protein n=1 Tax=Terrabacter sp. BE26 TaxID=2898152 RepID=UPI0035BE727F